MKRFSERMGITKPPEIQLNCMDEALRNSLWNIILMYLKPHFTDEGLKALCNELAFNFFKIPLDEIRSLGSGNFGLIRSRIEDWIKKKFDAFKWYEVYEFIEFLAQNEVPFKTSDFQEGLNHILEREYVGYRFVNEEFVPITNEEEIKEIESAIEDAGKVGLEGARKQLSQALSLLAKKPEPDYRNSVKESISAVESVAKLISGEHGGGLGPALNELSKKIEIHGALKQGFLNLYGYASDEDGIRHAILDEPNVGLDEAKFMLVSCSVFTNYLISKANKAGMLKETAKA